MKWNCFLANVHYRLLGKSLPSVPRTLFLKKIFAVPMVYTLLMYFHIMVIKYRGYKVPKRGCFPIPSNDHCTKCHLPSTFTRSVALFYFFFLLVSHFVISSLLKMMFFFCSCRVCASHSVDRSRVCAGCASPECRS